MVKNILIAVVGLLVGGFLAWISVFYLSLFPSTVQPLSFLQRPQVIGFLPYWLLGRAQKDYSPYITTLTYFGVRVNSDGKIQKIITVDTHKEEEPGWHALSSGKVTPFLTQAKKQHLKLSLLVDSGDSKTIDELLTNPHAHAANLVKDLSPLSQQYGFTDINMDIEYTAPASSSSRLAFTSFIKALREDLPKDQTLTVEISTSDVIRKNLIDIPAVSSIADSIVIMTYDFHAPDSFVTGPIAPLSGAGISSEYDVTAAIQKALTVVPSQKLIMGIPTYGYEWETLGRIPRSAVIPQTGVIASSERAMALASECATCSAKRDTQADEEYISYFSDDTMTNHILFTPTESSTKAKVSLAQAFHLGGIAVWALGYESKNILTPLTSYK